MNAKHKDTKLSQNENYGRPSAKKLHWRKIGWARWARGMAMLRQIHVEIASALTAKANAETALENSTKWSA